MLWKYLPITALSVYLVVFFMRPINLVVTDLGRHITNGANVLAGNWDVLYTNFYSYTEPTFPFINHHWGTGLVFHLVQSISGFAGLHSFYLGVILGTALLVVASLSSENRPIGYSVAIFMVPIMAYRTEIRPEGFSYLLMALVLFLLQNYYRGRGSWKKLLVSLVVIQLVWVNLHIFWPIGIGLAGLFWIRSLIDGNRQLSKPFLLGAVSLTLVSFLNPFGYEGVLAPFNILEEYGYMVAENQSWFFMFDRFRDADLVYFMIAGMVSILGVLRLRMRKTIRPNLWSILLAVGSFGLGLTVVRGITLFAFLSIPLFVAVIKTFDNGESNSIASRAAVAAAIFFVLVGFFTRNTVISPVKYYQVEERGEAKYVADNSIGLADGIHRSVNFFKQAKLPGTVFNNYDVGSFLIYGLEGEKLFVDNRPEAYSVSFFDDVYQPCQQDDNAWRSVVIQYGIETIFFYRHDNTPWGQDFLIRRVRDPEWIPIYVDALTIILIRNTEANSPWIDQYRLPDSMFGVKPN